MAPRIQRLSSPVKSKLRSGVNISSISQCVEELVLNAIDSGATNIAVRVDLSIFRIQVVDNGVGISEQDMKLIGTRYTTSKCHSLEDLKYKINQYGFRGEALASIVEMSGIVDISSRYKNSSKTLEKLFTYGIAKSPTLCKYNKPSCGTTITIQDFMYNMPVRRKSIKESIDIEVMKSNIERIMLVSPNIAVTFKNERVGCNILEIRKCKSLLETFLQLFGSEHEKNMSEVCHSLDQFKITGYISTQPHQTKKIQFVYINKRSVLQTKIHVLLNDLLCRSSIIRSKVLPNSTFPGPGKVPSSPPKGLKFYGIFVLNITCPRNEYDICLDPKKTLVEFRDWEKLLTCVEELILKFIKEENLTISLDDRFRKSEKEDSVSDFETPIPHSSQTILQAFSNTKQRGDREEFSKPLSKRIGFSDGIPAIYSLPARRHANVNIVKSTNSKPNEKLNKCNPDLVETHKDCPQVQVSKKFNNSPKYQLNCERKSPAKNISSLQALKHVDQNVEHDNKTIHVTITDPDGADKEKPCYSSLQELKLANKKDVNDDYITPTNKIVPSVYPNVVDRSIDETLDIYNDKQDSWVQKPQLKLVRNSMHDECNTVSRALGKQYKEVVKKKNILNSLQSFHFNKMDRPIRNKNEEKNVELQNGVKIHTTSDDGFVNTKIITKSKAGENKLNKSEGKNVELQNGVKIHTTSDEDYVNTKIITKSKARENKFFHFDTTEDILDEINVEDLLNDRNSFFNSESGAKKSCNRIEIESNFGSHQKWSSSIDKTKEIHIHCDSKLVTGEKSQNEIDNLLYNFKNPEMFLTSNNNNNNNNNILSPLSMTNYSEKKNRKSNILDVSDKPSNQCNGTKSSNNHESNSCCGITNTQSFVVRDMKTKSSDIENHSDLTPSNNTVSLITKDIEIQTINKENYIAGKTPLSEKNSLVSLSGKNNLNSDMKVSTQENIAVSEAFENREKTEDFNTNNNTIIIEETDNFSLRLNTNVDMKESEEISDNSLSSDLKNDLLNFFNSDKISSQEEIRQSINERIRKYSENSQVHFEGKILQIGEKKQIDCSNAPKPNPLDLKSHDDNHTLSSSFSEKNTCNNNNNNNNVTDNETLVSSSWKRVCNDEGKSFYVNIRTGNSAYDPPPPDPVPQWNSDQKMGECILKIPITDEHDPLGLDKRKTFDTCFSLSHGFDAFVPSKRKQLSESSSSKTKRINLSRKTSEIKEDHCSTSHPGHVDNTDSNNSNMHYSDNDQFCLSSKMKEALNEFLIENMLVDEPSKWGGIAESVSLPCEENNATLQPNDFWEKENNFPMDAEILTSYAENNPSYLSSKVKCYSIIHPYKFTKEMLKNCKVYGQVDDKFIAIAMSEDSSSLFHNLLVLVDQHAADERIQLEKVLFQSYEIKSLLSGIRRKVLKSERINSPIEATFKEEQVRIMKNFRDVFYEIGLEFTLVNDTEVMFHCLPCCLVPKEPNDRTTRRCQTAALIVKAAVVEMCENICTLGGTSSVDDVEGVRPLPRALSHVMNTIACKSAVKFGDKLSSRECEKIICSLKECRLPFQCAHGRPSLIPIVDLNYVKLKAKSMKPNLKKLHSFVSH